MPASVARRAPEVAQVGERRARRRLQDGSAQGSLQRDRRDGFADVADIHVQAVGVHPEPPDLRVRSRPADHLRPVLVLEAVDRAVVEHLAVLVAPRGVEDAARRELRRVADDQPVHQAHGVGAAQLVLEERAHVDERGRLADRVVLDDVGVVISAGGEEAGPRPPLQILVEGRCTWMEGGPDRHVACSSARRPHRAGRPGRGRHCARTTRRRRRPEPVAGPRAAPPSPRPQRPRGVRQARPRRRRVRARPSARSRPGCGSRPSPPATTRRRR